MNLVWQMRSARSMGGQVWCVLWPSRRSFDALRVVLLCPLPQPSGRLLSGREHRAPAYPCRQTSADSYSARLSYEEAPLPLLRLPFADLRLSTQK